MFRMKGVVPPMITPFTQSGEVDYNGVRTLTRFLKDRVDGLFITGSYGSTVLLSTEEREEIIRVVIEEAAGAVPVIAHVGTADSISSARLARFAVDCGADAVSAVGPYYYKHNMDSVCAFYRAIVDAVDGRVPVYVYNNPNFQGYQMELGLIKRLKEETGVRGIKDATFDIMTHANYLRTLRDDSFDVALGTEAMWLSAAVLGCETFVPGLGNAFPEICRQMYEEAMRCDYAACRETQFKVNKLRDIMYLAQSTQLAIYAMLEIRGVLKCYPRSPFISANTEQMAAITLELKKCDMI